MNRFFIFALLTISSIALVWSPWIAEPRGESSSDLGAVFALEAEAEGGEAEGKSDADPAAKNEKRDAEFQKLLSGATLAGQWRMTKDGKLGPERAEKYTLGEVKRKDGKWTVEARIEYGDKDVRVPIPVKVEWAGDTPVLSVTNLWVPGLGKYTARVMFYRGLYTGSWFGDGYGGLMSGVLVPKKAEGAPAKTTDKKEAR